VGPQGKRAGELVRTVRVPFIVAVSVIVLGVAGCGDASEPSSTAATQQSSTTTQAQGSSPDAADFLGATLASTTAGEPGVVVQSVQRGSRSRLKRGDVIIAFNGTPVASSDDLIRAIGTPKVGEQFTIKVVRGRHRFTLTEVQSPTAYLGANVKDGTRSVKGAVVDSVAANSPAARTDLQPGDVITAVDDTRVGSVGDLLQIIGTREPGDTISISVSRGSRQLDMTASLATRPTPSAGR
jgi:S1-C subfamily serine protease